MDFKTKINKINELFEKSPYNKQLEILEGLYDILNNQYPIETKLILSKLKIDSFLKENKEISLKILNMIDKYDLNLEKGTILIYKHNNLVIEKNMESIESIIQKYEIKDKNEILIIKAIFIEESNFISYQLRLLFDQINLIK